MNGTLPAVISSLAVNVYDDVTTHYFPGYHRSNAAKRDRAVLKRLTSVEALSALSRCGKDLDAALAIGEEASWAATPCAIPELETSDFLNGIKKLYPAARIGAVCCLRQVLNLLGKLDVAQPTDGHEIDDFVARQAETAQVTCDWPTLRYVGSAILQGLNLDELTPRHGSGAVATREYPWEKMRFKRLYKAMQEFYPADEYFYLNASHLADVPGLCRDGLPLEVLEEQTARLALVPKDFRGRRVISCEPLEAMWIQQGQFRAMTSYLESHPLTKGQINFHSQEVNRRLALLSSQSGVYNTLDLKDASDRVSLAVFRNVFPKPARERLEATRSTGTLLPDGRKIPLGCFAPMGSACCFPVESVCFYAIALAAIHDTFATQPGKHLYRWLNEHRGDVYVYGDDIIVRSQYSDCVMDALTRTGFILNRNKCCVGPRFRESCGMDAYDGSDVTPIRIRTLPNRRSPGSYTASIDLINRCNARGFLRTSAQLVKLTEEVFGPIPRVCTPGLVGIIAPRVEALAFNFEHFRSRWNTGYQRSEWLVPYPKQLLKRSETNCWSELFRCVLNVGSSQTGHAIPHRVQLIKRWMSC